MVNQKRKIMSFWKTTLANPSKLYIWKAQVSCRFKVKQICSKGYFLSWTTRLWTFPLYRSTANRASISRRHAKWHALSYLSSCQQLANSKQPHTQHSYQLLHYAMPHTLTVFTVLNNQAWNVSALFRGHVGSSNWVIGMRNVFHCPMPWGYDGIVFSALE